MWLYLFQRLHRVEADEEELERSEAREKEGMVGDEEMAERLVSFGNIYTCDSIWSAMLII